MLKYIAVKVFVTDGSGYDRKGAKIVKSADRLGSLPLWGRTAFFCFMDNDLIGDKFMKKVAILMGSDSDLPIVEKGIAVLKEYGIPHEVHVYSAHRTPLETAEFVSSAYDNGFGVMIAAAGMAAHLAGAVAANTVLPVIGIPISCKNTGGVDALWATVQMPSGIPVATVAIDGAANAAHLAAEILALSEPELREKLIAKREEGKIKVLEKDKAIAEKFNA